MIQANRIVAAVAHFDTAATNHKAQVFVFHEFDQTGLQQHNQAAVAVVRVGCRRGRVRRFCGRMSFKGSRSNSCSLYQPPTFCGFFGNQAVAADNFGICIVKREQVVAMLIIGIDIAAIIAFDFPPNSWAKPDSAIFGRLRFQLGF